MKENRIFLLVSKDWRNMIISTKKSRPGYRLSEEYAGVDCELAKGMLSDLGLQQNTPYSTMEYHTRLAEGLRPTRLELEKSLIKETHPLVKDSIIGVIDAIDGYQEVLDLAWLLDRRASKLDE